MRKTIIIGLDGARFDIVKKWANQGHLPNFKKMIEKGCSGNLKTLLPGPHSSPAWTSFSTGNKPGKHGITYMLMMKGNSYELKIANSNDVKSKRFWDYLSDSGKKVAILNVPMTYPPKPLNGVMITSWGTPALESDYTYPSELKNELEKKGFVLMADCFSRSRRSLQNLYKTTKKHMEMIKWIIQTRDPDLLVNVFFGTEQLHHLYASFLDKTHPQYDPDFERIIRDYYSIIDKFIGDLIKMYEDANLMIVSDHGFCAQREIVYLNNILKKHGFYKSKKDVIKKRKFYESFIVHSGTIYRKLPKTAQGFVRRVVPKEIKKKLRDTKELNADWKKTIAYCPAKIGTIYLNLKGREPEGVVTKQNYKKTVREIINKLKKDHYLKNRIKGIYPRGKLYKGQQIDKMPDITIHFKEGYECSYLTPKNKVWVPLTGETVGFHTMEGIFIAYGPDIKQGKSEDAELIDIAPTILFMYDIPLPKDIDGTVLKKIFRKGSDLSKRKIRYEQEKPKIKGTIRDVKI